MVRLITGDPIGISGVKYLCVAIRSSPRLCLLYCSSADRWLPLSLRRGHCLLLVVSLLLLLLFRACCVVIAFSALDLALVQKGCENSSASSSSSRPSLIVLLLCCLYRCSRCHFEYAATSWYMGSTEHLKHKHQVTQNKVVRFILNKPPIQHIGQNELDMVNLLNTEHRVKQPMMTHMYSIYNGNAPSYLCQRFIRIHDHHQHHTRLSEYCFGTQTRHNFVVEIRILSVKICINPYPSFTV